MNPINGLIKGIFPRDDRIYQHSAGQYRLICYPKNYHYYLLVVFIAFHCQRECHEV